MAHHELFEGSLVAARSATCERLVGPDLHRFMVRRNAGGAWERKGDGLLHVAL